MAFIRQTFRRMIRVPRGEPAPEVAAAVAALGINVGAVYVQAEVQSIADKVDAIVASLKDAGLMLDA